MRTLRAFADAGEMFRSGFRITQEAQRHPAGREVRVDAVEAFHRRRCLACNAIGGMRVVFVEQLAHQQPALLPPLVEIDERFRILRRGEDQPAGIFRLVVQAQPLHARINIAGVALRRGGHGIEQCFCIGGLAQHRRAGSRDGNFVAAEAIGGTGAGGGVVSIEARIHAHLVVGRREHAAEHLEHALFDAFACIVIAPRLPHETCSTLAVALREQRARQHVAALRGDRLLLGKEGAHSAIVDAVVPQRVLGAAAEQRGVGPARIGFDPGSVALERRIGVVGAQDHPFGKLARHGIADACLSCVGFRFAAFARWLRSRVFTAAISGVRRRVRRCDRKGAGRGSRQWLEVRTGFEKPAAQPDIGLRVRGEGGAVCVVFGLGLLSGGRRCRLCRILGGI